jgi:DHA1 family inner membrane transport protein
LSLGAVNALIRLAARDPAQRGAIMGLNSAVTYLAVFAGTIGFGPIYSSFGFAALPAIAAVPMLFVVFVTTRAARKIDLSVPAGVQPM